MTTTPSNEILKQKKTKQEGFFNGRTRNLQMESFIESKHPLWLIEDEGIYKIESTDGGKEVTYFCEEILHLCNTHNINLCNGLEWW